MGNERGFTLLEVLIALGILALALPILLGLRNFDLDLHARAKELTTATMLAQEKLTETELGTALSIGETNGEFLATPLGSLVPQMDRPLNYPWKRVVSPTPLQIIQEVKIQIIWPRGATEEMVEVSSYVFPPN